MPHGYVSMDLAMLSVGKMFEKFLEIRPPRLCSCFAVTWQKLRVKHAAMRDP